ncbi:MAG TPA: dihydroorotate dehydrogenase electron transfer subunit [Candidatus Jacksonbacteria bacterium]|nr:dihydroorotate dehydrogenase electron transfer subunit [Candidatus Jacksonbacteria bacterium]HCR15668.1 dihydroorotate dehydrogenase electron transfer subunit [Candidatus Jacksonbacteria bacterium]
MTYFDISNIPHLARPSKIRYDNHIFMAKHLESAKILSIRKIATDNFKLTLEAPKIAETAIPGQFVQLKVDHSLNPLLPRPLGISFANPKKGRLELIFKVVGRGTQILAESKKGAMIYITGPLGNGFWLEPDVKRVAIVAGGTGIGPILFLAKKWAENVNLFGFLGARRNDLLCGHLELARYCKRVDCATDDGSFGYKGLITELLQKKISEYQIQQVIACGPLPMMKAAVAVAQNLNLPSQVSLEERMACGTGICLGCAVKLADDKYHTVCTDGPVFRGNAVVW